MEPSDASIDWIVLADLVPGRELSGRAPAVDKDSLDGFLKECAPSIDVGGRTLAFREFKDFRPERLARQLPDASALLDLRQRALELVAGRGSAESLQEGLRRLEEYPELAAALEEIPKAPEPPPPPAPPPAPAAPPPSGGVFDLVDVEGARASAPAPKADLKGVLEEILGKDSPGGPSPAALKRLAALAEAAAGRVLNAVLHAPGFLRLESAWRGLRYFVRSLDFRAGVRLHVLPVPVSRLVHAAREIAFPLADDLRSQGRLAGLLLDFAFDLSGESTGRAAEIARLAAPRSIPVLASAEPGGPVREMAARWSGPALDALRSLDEARWLALAVNGFLLRAPYGKDADPVREFPFEETGGPGPWGRPAWLLGALVSAALVRSGWGVDFAGREAAGALESLPVRTAELRHGEAVQIPLEEDLGEAEARALGEAGLLPLACRRNDDRPFAAGAAAVAPGATLRDALFAAWLGAKLQPLAAYIDPSRDLEEIARTLKAGLELLGLTERGPEFAVETSVGQDPPAVLMRVRPCGPRLRGLADLSFEVPVPLH